MAAPAIRLLTPAALAALNDLELIARTVVEGYLSGRHLLPQAGAGIEFAQYRSYDPGDDLRRIDWKVFARADRFYVRQSEVERDVTVRFLLDATGSMAHRDGDISKLDYARMLVAALAYLADRQGDRLALHLVTGDACVDVLPRGRRPLMQLLHALAQVEAAGRWPDFANLEGHLVTGRARELMVVVSDLYDDQAGMETTLRNLRALGHEIMVLQLAARNELEFDFSGDVVFRDLETGEEIAGNAAAMRSSWDAALAAEHEKWKQELLRLRVAHALVPMDQPFELALREFLLHRRDLPA